MKHSDETARQLNRTAWALFTRHDCQGSRLIEMKENCGACCLGGYRPSKDKDWPTNAPNYSGWARAYVQAGRYIPLKYALAFKAELTRADNPEYSKALKTDIRTFGAHFSRLLSITHNPEDITS